jgi:hypothetical protein
MFDVYFKYKNSERDVNVVFGNKDELIEFLDNDFDIDYSKLNNDLLKDRSEIDYMCIIENGVKVLDYLS